MENQIFAVKDLIPTTPWGEIWEELLRYYPWIIKEEEGYKEVFNKLHFIVAKPSDLVLKIRIFFDDGRRGADAAAYNDECPGGYSLMATPWGEVLGYTIAPETLEQLSHAEILALCMYDITWYGSWEEEINETCEHIQAVSPPPEEFEVIDRFINRLCEENPDEAVFKEKLDELMTSIGFSDLDFSDLDS